MEPIEFKKLILSLIQILNEEHIGFGKTKLIKLAYLVELEYFRKFRTRLTNTDWYYYKYGPYPLNEQDYLEHDLIGNDLETESGFKPIYLKEPFDINTLPLDIKKMEKKIISKYAKLELNDLLQYVYFETEPMLAVDERMQKLDFSVSYTEEETIIKKLETPPKELKKIKNKFREKFQYAKPL